MVSAGAGSHQGDPWKKIARCESMPAVTAKPFQSRCLAWTRHELAGILPRSTLEQGLRKTMLTSKRTRDHQLIENQQHLAQWVRDTRGPLDLAVAFWGKGAVEELSLKKARPIRVLLELQSGGTNPAEVRRLMDLAHVEVRQLPRLHAKVYIANNAVLIGSTNASANGLGSEGSESTRWHELAVRTNDLAVVRDTQRWLRRSGLRANRSNGLT